MKQRRFLILMLAALVAGGVYTAQRADAQQRNMRRKRILAIGAVNGWQHDSVSHALATIEKMGQQTGLYDTYIRTDTQLVTKKKFNGLNIKNLDDFDAVVFYTTGELDMDPEQRASLLSFVRDDGKGFVGVHSAIDTFYRWPEYGEMVGAYFDGHPWNTFEAPVIVEDREFPATKHFPKAFTTYDEIYQPNSLFSRDKVRVLARLDENKIDLAQKGVKRTDKDFAVAWVKSYGKGRVFYSTFGHTESSWDRADVQQMYYEAIRWALGSSKGDATPRPRPN
jgi:type 1 glutamine amidotransferase